MCSGYRTAQVTRTVRQGDNDQCKSKKKSTKTRQVDRSSAGTWADALSLTLRKEMRSKLFKSVWTETAPVGEDLTPLLPPEIHPGRSSA